MMMFSEAVLIIYLINSKPPVLPGSQLQNKGEKMAIETGNALKRFAQWRDSLDRACGFDSWGQVCAA